jgi:mono/diheme cytochrome c family protein
LPGVVALLVTSVACESGRHASTGFRLPQDGDPERGKVTFVALECHTCHKVSGMDLPEPTAQPPVPVMLGGEVQVEPTDGDLATSIIYPSCRLAHYPKQLITRAAGESRMPAYADRISVRQMTDLVAFLQSRYVVRPPMPKYYYH